MEAYLIHVRAEIQKLVKEERRTSEILINFNSLLARYKITDITLGYFVLLPAEITRLIFSQVTINISCLVLCKELYAMVTGDDVFVNTFFTALHNHKHEVLQNMQRDGVFNIYIKPISNKSYFTLLKLLYAESTEKVVIELPSIMFTLKTSFVDIQVIRGTDYVVVITRITNTNFVRVNILWKKVTREGIYFYNNTNDIQCSVKCQAIREGISSVTYQIPSSKSFEIIPLEPKHKIIYIATSNPKISMMILSTRTGFTVIKGNIIDNMLVPEGDNLFMFKRFIKKLFRGSLGKILLGKVLDICTKSGLSDLKQALEHVCMTKYNTHVYIPDRYFKGVGTSQ